MVCSSCLCLSLAWLPNLVERAQDFNFLGCWFKPQLGKVNIIRFRKYLHLWSGAVVSYFQRKTLVLVMATRNLAGITGSSDRYNWMTSKNIRTNNALSVSRASDFPEEDHKLHPRAQDCLLVRKKNVFLVCFMWRSCHLFLRTRSHV